MESLPIQIQGSCVLSEDGIFRNMAKACLRGLPEITHIHLPNTTVFCLVGSGPSLATQLELLRALQHQGAKVMAIRDAHDYLIANGLIPDYALSVDPLPSAADCFKAPHPDVHYLISSQSDDAMFEFLKGANVTLWHGYVKEGQTEPKGKFLIGGATTSGLRGLVVAYVLGYRDFRLFGLDSCMNKEGILRINGTGPGVDKEIFPIQIERGGREFHCNASMALQAQNFQDLYEHLPEATFTGYGDGLIQAIILQRNANRKRLEAIRPITKNDRVSFIHAGGPQMASYRYRAAIPAQYLRAEINDWTASTLIFSKPLPHELIQMAEARLKGQRVVVDFCDDHFEWIHYQEALRLADVLVCGTTVMAERIKACRKWIDKPEPIVIPDPWEFPLQAPHAAGWRTLWFGHAVNRPSLMRILPDLEGMDLRVVSNFEGAIPWSMETLYHELTLADIVVMPASDTYKGANRTVEAVRSGCFVIAEPHPAIADIPGIYIGNIKEGIEWLKQQPLLEVHRRISMAQKYVTDAFSPSTVASAWKTAIGSPTTLEVVEVPGPDGPMSISPEVARI
jgi:hypothetical protein